MNYIAKNKLVKEDYRFSDEREWRWVPSHTESFMKGLPPLMTESQYKNKKVLNEYNLKLFNAPRLQYELQSINYIIVKNDSDIPRIIEVLDDSEFRSKGGT